MTKQECEQLQGDIITHCEDMPYELVSDLCQTVVDYYKKTKRCSCPWCKDGMIPKL